MNKWTCLECNWTGHQTELKQEPDERYTLVTAFVDVCPECGADTFKEAAPRCEDATIEDLPFDVNKI